eukprot:2099690-Pyramimonas_sp.AAC.1
MSALLSGGRLGVVACWLGSAVAVETLDFRSLGARAAKQRSHSTRVSRPRVRRPPLPSNR